MFSTLFRTGWQLLGIELEEEMILEKVGAAFGLDTEDILLPVKDQERSLTMEVVMSPPMIQVIVTSIILSPTNALIGNPSKTT